MSERTRNNLNAIIYGTFYSYPVTSYGPNGSLDRPISMENDAWWVGALICG